MFSREPMNITFYLARLRTALGLRIVGAMDRHYVPARIFIDAYTFDDVAIAQPHFRAGRQAKIAVARHLHKIVALDP